MQPKHYRITGQTLLAVAILAMTSLPATALPAPFEARDSRATTVAPVAPVQLAQHFSFSFGSGFPAYGNRYRRGHRFNNYGRSHRRTQRRGCSPLVRFGGRHGGRHGGFGLITIPCYDSGSHFRGRDGGRGGRGGGGRTGRR